MWDGILLPVCSRLKKRLSDRISTGTEFERLIESFDVDPLL